MERSIERVSNLQESPRQSLYDQSIIIAGLNFLKIFSEYGLESQYSRQYCSRDCSSFDIRSHYLNKIIVHYKQLSRNGLLKWKLRKYLSPWSIIIRKALIQILSFKYSQPYNLDFNALQFQIFK